MIAPVGGRDDYGALFHEAGHTEHYANVTEGLPFEFRHLGDNSVTESFAFLLENLTEDPLWLQDHLGLGDASATVAQGRAARLVLLRRYAGKIAYELELARRLAGPRCDARPLLAAARRSHPGRLAPAAWVTDVDPGFYVACYLRAWALETYWRAELQRALRRALVREHGGGRLAARPVGARPAPPTPTSWPRAEASRASSSTSASTGPAA